MRGRQGGSIVNAATPDTWERGKQNVAVAKNVGVNLFLSFVTDAWTNQNETRTNQTIQSVADARPETKHYLPVVWKALKKLDSITDEHRMVLMSMIGSVILPTGSETVEPIPLPRKEITVLSRYAQYIRYHHRSNL